MDLGFSEDATALISRYMLVYFTSGAINALVYERSKVLQFGRRNLRGGIKIISLRTYNDCVYLLAVRSYITTQ